MIKHYLIPLEITIDPTDGEPDRHPKYVMGMGINWAAVDLASDNMFMVVVNTKPSLDNKHIELASKSDVIVLDNTRGNKDKVKTKLNLPESIRDDEDEVEVIGKRVDSNFKNDRAHLFVAE